LGIGSSPLPNLRGDVKDKRQEEADCINGVKKCTERRRSTVKNKERKEEG